MEARLYAEDPRTGFLPSTGVLQALHLDDQVARIETGVSQGSEISPYYDPMIAKIVSSGSTRDEARDKLAFSCDDVVTWPVRNNAGFLAALLGHSDFVAGQIDTGFIAKQGKTLLEGSAATEVLINNAATNIFLREGGTRFAINADSDDVWGNPWHDLLGTRVNAEPKLTVRMSMDGMAVEGTVSTKTRGSMSILSWVDGGAVLVDRGWPHLFELFRTDGGTHHSAHDGDILSPMPGKIIAVEVTAGDTVTKGQKLLTLEAMKMEHSLTAPFDGVVAELNAVAGAQVQVEALLARIEVAE